MKVSAQAYFYGKCSTVLALTIQIPPMAHNMVFWISTKRYPNMV